MNVQIGLHDRKCGQCGKAFECRMEHAYKLERDDSSNVYVWFCSWKCIQEYRAENKNKKPLTKRRQEVMDLLGEGLSCMEVSRRLGISRTRVWDIKNMCEE